MLCYKKKKMQYATTTIYKQFHYRSERAYRLLASRLSHYMMTTSIDNFFHPHHSTASYYWTVRTYCIPVYALLTHCICTVPYTVIVSIQRVHYCIYCMLLARDPWRMMCLFKTLLTLNILLNTCLKAYIKSYTALNIRDILPPVYHFWKRKCI